MNWFKAAKMAAHVAVSQMTSPAHVAGIRAHEYRGYAIARNTGYHREAMDDAMDETRESAQQEEEDEE